MKKNFKKIALIISVFVVSLIGVSSIVYGRFTRQFNPEVSSFGVTISSQENIMVSKTGNPGTFTDSIKLSELVSDSDVTLSPLVGKVTTTNDSTYSILSLTNKDGSAANVRNYLAFNLFFIGSSDMNLYLAGNTSGTVAIFDDSNADKSFTNEQRNRLLANLRVGFLTYSTTYQPSGTGTTIVYSESPIATNIYATSVVSSDNYTTFNRLGFSNTENDTILATTTKNEITKIRVVIWLEEDNIDDLEAICRLTLSVRFEAVLANN